MKRTLLGGLAALVLATLAGAKPALAGHWRMDPDLSTALDGWHKMDLVIGLEGSQVAITHRMQWRSTKLEATNTFDTAQPVSLKDFFRVEARHMAIYPARDGVTHAKATWLDEGRTLRVEATTPIEVSQGKGSIRLYQEYRVDELGQTLTFIELRSSRDLPLIYVLHRVKEEATK
jgi:hypothetical protein